LAALFVGGFLRFAVDGQLHFGSPAIFLSVRGKFWLCPRRIAHATSGLDSFDDYSAILGAFKPVFAHLAVGRAVVPGFRFRRAGKFGDQNALALRSFENLFSPIGGEDF
jgi:hypothetical protein